MKGVEPSYLPWEGNVIAVIRHSHLVGLAGLEPATFGLEVLLRLELKSPQIPYGILTFRRQHFVRFSEQLCIESAALTN